MKRSVLTSAAVLLLAAGLLSTVSCGDTKDPEKKPEGSDTESTKAVEDNYKYPDLDLGNREFTILNTHQEYAFYTALDFESTTGEGLDDAVYERNRKLEQQYNFRLKIDNEHILEEAATALEQSVLSNDHAYDSAFIRNYYMTNLLTDGAVLDMQDISTLHFDEPWWDTEATEQSRLGTEKKIMYSFCDISFADFEGTVCMFFNEKLLNNLDLTLPYELVNQNKWTLDEMNKILVAGTNLNGDDSFTWSTEGRAIYGLLSWDQCFDSLVIGSDLDYFTINKDNAIEFAANNDKFFERALKINDIMSVDGRYMELNSATGNDHYEWAFMNSRCMLMVAELKATNKYRNMEDPFGIVPIPKYDEQQENYRNLRAFTYVMCIPTTCEKPEEVGAVMDTMAYLTYKDVLPYFYESHISQKMLRNEDSVKMLEIIQGSRYNDIGIPYGLSDSIRGTIRTSLSSGNKDIASTIDAQLSSIEAKIEKTMDLLNEQE